MLCTILSYLSGHFLATFIKDAAAYLLSLLPPQKKKVIFSTRPKRTSNPIRPKLKTDSPAATFLSDVHLPPASMNFQSKQKANPPPHKKLHFTLPPAFTSLLASLFWNTIFSISAFDFRSFLYSVHTNAFNLFLL